jgi:HK97 family phage prohead protease
MPSDVKPMPPRAPRTDDTGRERRMLAGEVRSLRRADGDTAEVIQGMAALFNAETQIGYDWWAFREVIRPGAFTRAVAEDDVRGLFNHDPNLVLGRNRAGTLRLEETGEGLRYEIDPPDASYARDLVQSIRRGDVTGSSFMFTVRKETWTDPPEGSAELPLREILEAELYDVSPVTFPAYDETTVSAHARDRLQAARDARRERDDDEPAAPTAVDASPVVELAARRNAVLKSKLASV